MPGMKPVFADGSEGATYTTFTVTFPANVREREQEKERERERERAFQNISVESF